MILLVCPGISTFADRGDELEVDFQSGVVTNCSSGKSKRSDPIPKPVMEIILAGGIVPYLKARIGKIRKEERIDSERKRAP
jgi:3-isopropylmalate/(R)-2-methylmalate dehydratase small subunit